MPTPKNKKHLSKRYSAYLDRLSTLRQYVGGFDDKKLADLYLSKPRSEKGKREKARKLAKVASTFRTLRPYLSRPHKRVSSKSADKIEQLRTYSGVPKIKGLRAVPVEAIDPKRAKVSFDKKGRLTVKEGARKEVLIRFPRKPRAHRTKDGRYLTAGEHLREMVKALLSTLPRGMYVLQSKQHMLVPMAAEKAAIPKMIDQFLTGYETRAPGFIESITGLRWLAQSAESFMRRQADMQEARTDAGRRRVQRRRIAREKAARQLARKNKGKKRGR